MNIELAKKFIESSGNQVEIARLQYIVNQKEPSREIYTLLVESQNEDGGWPPFWATNMSSLDATCYYLSQIEQLGIKNDIIIDKACKLLIFRQQKDGSFEEDVDDKSLAPPWAQPGEIKAKLYMTANCGFWIEYFNSGSIHSKDACSYLRRYLNKDGMLPSFVHTNWLAASLFYRLGYREEAKKIIENLNTIIHKMPASNIVWLLNAFFIMGVKIKKELITEAFKRLTILQKQDGRWASDDGPNFDVHITLDALRACLSYQKNENIKI